VSAVECNNCRRSIAINNLCDTESPDGSVGIAAGYGRDDRGVGVPIPAGSRIFTS
jgi:hypothetical protein